MDAEQALQKINEGYKEEVKLYIETYKESNKHITDMMNKNGEVLDIIIGSVKGLINNDKIDQKIKNKLSKNMNRVTGRHNRLAKKLSWFYDIKENEILNIIKKYDKNIDLNSIKFYYTVMEYVRENNIETTESLKKYYNMI